MVTPSQRLAIIEGREPGFTPGERLRFFEGKVPPRGATSGSEKVAKVIEEARRRTEEARRLRKIEDEKRRRALEDFNRRIKETQERIQREKKLKKLKLNLKEKRSLMAREEIRIVAAQRGRGFSKSEVQRFIKKKGV